jgi:hypothetical protein
MTQGRIERWHQQLTVRFMRSERQQNAIRASAKFHRDCLIEGEAILWPPSAGGAMSIRCRLRAVRCGKPNDDNDRIRPRSSNLDGLCAPLSANDTGPAILAAVMAIWREGSDLAKERPVG